MTETKQEVMTVTLNDDPADVEVYAYTTQEDKANTTRGILSCFVAENSSQQFYYPSTFKKILKMDESELRDEKVRLNAEKDISLDDLRRVELLLNVLLIIRYSATDLTRSFEIRNPRMTDSQWADHTYDFFKNPHFPFKITDTRIFLPDSEFDVLLAATELHGWQTDIHTVKYFDFTE